uniref:Potassium channel tetramerisation-type BTB domain-containing protein n=1 Tax=Arcella intermedia TaxID=1963864 RepID=A0A6B2LC66_9EUKA
MFSGRWDLKVQDDGTIFIDRDPFVFRYIANAMRGQIVDLKDLTKAEMNALKVEATFYQIQGLLKIFERAFLDFPYKENGDTNGLLYWIGTKKGTQAYSNPLSSKSIVVSTSHPFSWSNVEKVFSRTYENKPCGINGGKEPVWMKISLPCPFRLSHYTLWHGNAAGYALGRWVLEGSNDEKAWVTIKEHDEPDWHNKTYNCVKTWGLANGMEVFWQHLRLRLLAPSPNYAVYGFMVSGLEFYGQSFYDPTQATSPWTPDN